MTTQFDRYGLALSTTSNVAASHYERAVDRLLTENGLPRDELAAAVGADPDFALARALAAMVARASGERSVAREGIARALALPASDRERDHIAIIAHVIGDRARDAAVAAHAHLQRYPLDALALLTALSFAYMSGNRARREAALALVEALVPWYPEGDWFIDGAAAFVREEVGHYEDAQALARRSLASRPDNAHAAHCLAHVLYETGRYDECIRWLTPWVEAHPFPARKPHLWFHVGICHLRLGARDALETVYDRELALRVDSDGGALIDAANLLWRRYLAGAPASDARRWQQLAVAARQAVDGQVHPASLAHCALTFAATGDRQGMTALRERIGAIADGGVGPLVARLVADIDAFARGDHALAAAGLARSMPDLVTLGGTNLQRSVFADTLDVARARLAALSRSDAVPDWTQSGQGEGAKTALQGV